MLTLSGQNEGTREDEPRLVLAFEKYIAAAEANNRFVAILRLHSLLNFNVHQKSPQIFITFSDTY